MGASAALNELATSAPGTSCAYILTPDLAFTEKSHIQFDVKLPTAAYADFRRFMRLGFDDLDFAITLGWRGDELRFSTTASIESFAISSGWHRINIRRDAGRFVLLVDGVQLSNAPTTVLLTPTRVQLGILDAIAGDISVSYDNVLVANQP